MSASLSDDGLRQNLVLRAMTPADLEGVAALAKRADAWGWSLRNFQDALAAGYSARVAEAGGMLAGYCVVMTVIDEAELLEIAVDPVLQHRGFGRALLADAIACARNQGAGVLHLEVRDGNGRARKMYLCAGFREVGRRRGYYPCETGREDAVLMTLRLGAQTPPGTAPAT